jgi:hypothetical protein
MIVDVKIDNISSPLPGSNAQYRPAVAPPVRNQTEVTRLGGGGAQEHEVGASDAVSEIRGRKAEATNLCDSLGAKEVQSRMSVMQLNAARCR